MKPQSSTILVVQFYIPGNKPEYMSFERDGKTVNSNLFASPLFASLFEDSEQGRQWAEGRLKEFIEYTELDGQYAHVVRMSIQITEAT